MRTLHFPVNYGSLTSHTVRTLRLSGIEASGLVFNAHAIQSADMLTTLRFISRRYPPRFLSTRLAWIYQLLRHLATLRPDLIHWYSGIDPLRVGLERRIVEALKIPGVVEWQGSDIRIPEVEFVENPYYKAVYENPESGYEYRATESEYNSRRRQQRFARSGFMFAAPIGMMPHVLKDIFPTPYLIPQRLIVADYQAVYPDPTRHVPVVVHSPSAPVAKGTATVLKAVKTLKEKYDFDFQLITGVPREQALRMMQNADIFLDQFVWGDRGMAALEAMALGKPVICYIKPSLVTQYPADSPIVNASSDTLIETLKELLLNGRRRFELGKQGRAFVERTYQPLSTAAELVNMYESVIKDYHRHRVSG